MALGRLMFCAIRSAQNMTAVSIEQVSLLGKLVGDPGIEPGVGHPEGVTVPCHTLRPDAHRSHPKQAAWGRDNGPSGQRQRQKLAALGVLAICASAR